MPLGRNGGTTPDAFGWAHRSFDPVRFLGLILRQLIKAPIVCLSNRGVSCVGSASGSCHIEEAQTEAANFKIQKKQKAFDARLRADQRVLSQTVGMRSPRYRLVLEQDLNPAQQEPNTALVEWIVHTGLKCGLSNAIILIQIWTPPRVDWTGSVAR